MRIFRLAALAVSSFAADPLLLVLNKGDANLVIVDIATKKILGRVPTGEGPHELATSTDGKTAFVANYGAQTPGSTLSIIDLTTQKEVRRVDLGALRRPHGIAFANGKVYFTAEVNRLIARYDPVTNQIDWIMGTGQALTHMVYPTKDLSMIVTANIGSDSLTIIERTGAQTVIPVGKGPEGFDISPDGKEIWAANSRDGSVSIVDIATKKTVHTIPGLTKRSNRLKFTPDGKLALISDLEANLLVVVDTATRKETKRIKTGQTPEGILMSPDGVTAYVAMAGDGHVATIDLKTLEITGKIETGAGPDGMAWAAR